MQVRVGVGVIVIKEKKILLGHRLNAHGSGSWAPPGGHLEFLETPEECARRELLEETGLTVGSITPITFTNDIYTAENKHYITLFMAAEFLSGVATVLEPHKCKEWKWFALDALPDNLFLSFHNFIKKLHDLKQQSLDTLDNFSVFKEII